MPHDLDLAETSGELADSGTLALYDPVAERIVVRGTEMTDGLRVTLVHELVHVAQDQAFDLERPPTGRVVGRLRGVRMLVEGDADRIDAPVRRAPRRRGAGRPTRPR